MDYTTQICIKTFLLSTTSEGLFNPIHISHLLYIILEYESRAFIIMFMQGSDSCETLQVAQQVGIAYQRHKRGVVSFYFPILEEGGILTTLSFSMLF